MTWFLTVLVIIAALLAILRCWRVLDSRADEQTRQRFIDNQVEPAQVFTLSMVKGLPEPAIRYFKYTIAEGTPLNTVAEIKMSGEIGMGSKSEPKYRPMQAKQILAPPFGLVWQLNAGALSGSDGVTPDDSWTRFWLFNLIPVVRAGSADHHRSAFGRVVAEAAFWVPASLLPGEHVRWQPLDQNSARAIVTYQRLTQAVDITVDNVGAPTQVLIQRWSNENPDRVFREQPFGGYLSACQSFGGFRLPTRIEGGNLIGTPDYFAFFKAQVHSIEFPDSRDRSSC